MGITTIKRYQTVFNQLRVVVRPEDMNLQQQYRDLGCLVVTACQADLGMGHSLAQGIVGVNWEWVFVGLLDMPWIHTDTLASLVGAALKTKQTIVRPVYQNQTEQNQPGHPVGFHKQWLSALENLTGDQGARQIVAEYPNDRLDLVFDDPGILQDIDRPDDLKH